jgi:plastocyanin
MPVPHRLLALTAAASVGAFGVAAVAVAKDDGGAGGATASAARTKSLHLTANAKNKLRFNTTHLTAKAGKVTIVMSNPSNLPHGVAVEGRGVDKDGKIVGKGKTSRVTVTLKRGTYTFYCPFDGHRKAGMKGKLVVR